MRFCVLGSLEVVGADGPVQLGRGKRRSLLTLLLIHSNEVVSQDRLIDALWGPRPPAAPRTALQVLVSDLRKELGADVLLTRPSGYVLAVEATDIDVTDFTRLVDGGTRALAAGDAHGAEGKLRSALALWRGSAFQDVAYEEFAQAEIARLEELRVQTEEELIEAELALGRGGELVPKLEALIAAHPHRERLRGQFMLALYRAQRQGEALAAYQQARAMLVDELGVEPSPGLRRLQQAILNQDPELEAQKPLPRLARPPRRRLLVLCLLGGAAFAGLGLALFFALRGGGVSQPPPPLVVPRRSVVAIDPATNVLTAAIPLEPRPLATPVQPTDLAVGYGSVWISDAGQQEIVRLDPKKRDISATIGVGADVQALAIGFGSVWVADGNSATVTRIDPIRNRVVATVPLGSSGGTPSASFAIAVGAGAVWATGGDNLVERIDPLTNHVVERIPVGDPRSLAANAISVWCGTKSGEIVRIAPGPGRSRVTNFATIEPGLVRIAVRGHALWAAVPGASVEIWQYDTRTRRLVSTLVAGEIVLDFAVASDAVWVPLYREGEVIRIDPVRNVIASRIVVRPGASFVAVGDGAVWGVVG
jgi:DNA-binding SARP family transcriptional activator/streptogramin lyase